MTQIYTLKLVQIKLLFQCKTLLQCDNWLQLQNRVDPCIFASQQPWILFFFFFQYLCEFFVCANGVLSMFKIYFKNHLEGVRALRVWPWACGPSLTHPAGRWSILILFPNSYYCTCGSWGMWITICRSGVSGKRVTIRPTSPKKGMGTPGWTTFRNLSFSSTSLPRFCHRSAHMLSPFGILHSHLRRRHPTHPHPQKKKKKVQ